MITVTFEVSTPEEAAALLARVSGGPIAVGIATTPRPGMAPNQADLGPAPDLSVTEPDPPSAPLASPAVLKLMAENDLLDREIIGTGKNGNILKSDVVAYLKANTLPAPPEDDPFAMDDEPPLVAPATKEQVRAALVSFQSALRDSLIAQGEPEESAKTTGMETARSLLTKTGNGAATLGALAESQYGAVVLAATAAMNALSA